MSTLEKKLAQEAKKTTDQSESLITDVKLLLDSNMAEERNTLRSIGLDNDIKFIESKQEDLLIRKVGKEKFDREVVRLDEIKSFCEKYRLSMKHTSKFIGTIPPELGSELTRFCKEKSIAISSSSEYNKFFIIAPPKMFNTYKSFGSITIEAINGEIERARERKRLRDEDPILVYQYSDTHFAIIKSWGKNFTPMRRLYGMLSTPFGTSLISSAFTMLVTYMLYKIAMVQSSFFYHLNENVAKDNHPAIVIAGVLDFAILVIAVIWLFTDPFHSLRRHIRRSMTHKDFIDYRSR